MKQRIDQVLVERGFAESRHQAQALVLAGLVFVNGQKAEKPGQRIDTHAAVLVAGKMPFVSRGGLKLQAALDRFAVRVAGRICADLGSSTGGFTDCLLQYGAREVHAYDVGRGQIAWKLRTDPRVVLHEGCNVRYLTAGDLPPGVSLVTVDLSFISLTKVLGPLRAALCGKAGASPVELILLVKPQFELGKGRVGKGGIVRDPESRLAAVRAVADHACAAGYALGDVIPCPIPGAEGNQEFFMYLMLEPDLSSVSP